MKPIIMMFIYLATVTPTLGANDILWQKQLSCEPNSTCRLAAMAVDPLGNSLILLGTSELSGKKEMGLRLWKIGLNGSVRQADSLALLSEYDSYKTRLYGIRMVVGSNTGEIIRLNMDNPGSVSLSITNKDMQQRTVKVGSGKSWSAGVTFLDMTSLRDGSALLVGQDSGADGIVVKTDLSGQVIWKRVFDRGQTEILSSVACSSTDNGFYVSGVSLSMQSKMMLAGPAVVCLLHYDDDGQVKSSDFFEGGLAPWPTSLPKVIWLPSGIVVVVYDKSKNGKATELYLRGYTPRMEFLYEKPILETGQDGPPAFFDLCATSENHFAFAGVVNFEDLRVCEGNAEGTILKTLELDGQVRAIGMHVDYLAGNVFVAYVAKADDGGDRAKIKVIALKPHEYRP